MFTKQKNKTHALEQEKPNFYLNIKLDRLIHIGILVILGLTTSCSTRAFFDVPESDPHSSIYSHLNDVKIMSPSSDGNFYPEKPVSRAEALTIALRAGGIEIPTDFDGNTYFSDIDPNTWYAPIISRAIKTKVIAPTYTNFRPTQNVTKAEFLAFLFKSTHIKLELYKHERDIAKDIPNGSWMTPFFAYAKKYQIAYLPPDGFYLPNKNLSRKEVALMTYRQLKIFHGSEETSQLIELEASIQKFMELVKNGKNEEAEFYVHEIETLNDKIIRKKNNQDAVAALAISRAMEHLSDSLRYFRYGKNLEAIENLHLSLKQAKKAEQKSLAMAPLARELSGLIGETIFVFNKPEIKLTLQNNHE